MAETTIPSQMLPADLSLPALARISFGEDTIKIEVQFLGPESDFWQADDAEGVYRSFELGKDDMLRIVIGDRWRDGPRHAKSCAILEIRDPYEVEDSLQIRFASLDQNNPDYWIKFLVKKLNQRYGLPIVQIEKRIEEEDIPF